MKKKKSLGSIILGLLAAAVVWFLQEKGFLEKDGSLGSGAEVPAGAVSAENFTRVQTQGQGWTLLQNCRLVTGRNGDGDSFHVKHEKGETEFRLYFVDTPESEFKQYGGGENNGKRLAEQGEYFGGLGQGDTTTVGRASKELVKKILSKNDFQVLTKWENVYGPDRKYCLVVIPWEGREIYLHELLVAKGLARIHTRGANLPQGRGYQDQKSFLKGLEQDAREKKVGAWGL
ncbi:thermonuclease family protein [Roseibacillus persicicus]|uniref:TNase-like domain-containing protein n=1 Tax=Roseibacillus persicicus TaxID=454148 RepID=A0A918TSP7_9BACT|nr:thermonuclease family protein [Roseibacillus persicicus]GHC61231.1 hypothetical protein GCM10007100_30650 [Roseibacillus persicicus]